MTDILIPVLIVSGIGLLAGILLAVLSKIMAVPVDEKEEAIVEVLPGANCGACGFSGCSGYAAALSKGETVQTGLCAPGGNDVSVKIAEIMGLAASEIKPMTAVVRCNGGDECAQKKMIYSGVESCKMASQLFGGDKACIYGCLGLGDCVKECPYNAIKICDGVAIVNPNLCKACKKCVAVCPKELIELMPKDEKNAVILCRNHDKGAVTKNECSAGCIGCTKCVKKCPQEAISMDNSCAKVDYSKCIGCGECESACPVGAVKIHN